MAGGYQSKLRQLLKTSSASTGLHQVMHKHPPDPTRTQSCNWTWKIPSCRTQDDETLHLCRHPLWCRFGHDQCQSASPSRTSYGEGEWWESIKGWWQVGGQNHFAKGGINLKLHFTPPFPFQKVNNQLTGGGRTSLQRQRHMTKQRDWGVVPRRQMVSKIRKAGDRFISHFLFHSTRSTTSWQVSSTWHQVLVFRLVKAGDRRRRIAIHINFSLILWLFLHISIIVSYAHMLHISIILLNNKFIYILSKKLTLMNKLSLDHAWAMKDHCWQTACICYYDLLGRSMFSRLPECLTSFQYQKYQIPVDVSNGIHCTFHTISTIQLNLFWRLAPFTGGTRHITFECNNAQMLSRRRRRRREGVARAGEVPPQKELRS